MAENKNKIDKIAPCGVFCGACPSFNKSCNGCSSEDKKQKRISKFGCKIRICCYNEKGLDYCIDCNQYPCKFINKLLNTHPKDPRYTYRHEITNIFIKLKSMSINEYLNFQLQRWKCDSCGGTIKFYNYKCDKCGKEKMIK